MDVGKAIETFTLKMHSKNWSQATIKNYTSQVRIFLTHFRSYPKAREISAEEIEHYLLTKAQVNTRKHARCGINAFYKLVVGQPQKLRLIPWPKREQKLVQFLTHDEAAALISRTPSPVSSMNL